MIKNDSGLINHINFDSSWLRTDWALLHLNQTDSVIYIWFKLYASYSIWFKLIQSNQFDSGWTDHIKFDLSWFGQVHLIQTYRYTFDSVWTDYTKFDLNWFSHFMLIQIELIILNLIQIDLVIRFDSDWLNYIRFDSVMSVWFWLNQSY